MSSIPSTAANEASDEPCPVQTVARGSRRRLAIASVAVYMSMLVLSTHWPRLSLPKLPVPMGIDKVLHFTGYAILTLLILLTPTGMFRLPEGGVRQPAWQSAATILVLIALWGVFDEVTQPFVGRGMDPVDWSYNIAGSVTALALVSLGYSVAWLFGRRGDSPSA